MTEAESSRADSSAEMRARRVLGWNNESAKRRTRRTRSALDCFREIIRLAAEQKEHAERVARTRAYVATHGPRWIAAERERAALAAFSARPAKAPAARMTKETKAARDAALSPQERAALARMKKGGPLAERDLTRQRAKRRRAARCYLSALALVARRRFPAVAALCLRLASASRTGRLRPLWRARDAERAAMIVARQRARIQYLGSVAVRVAESGERIGRKALRAAKADGAPALNASETAGEWVERDGWEELGGERLEYAAGESLGAVTLDIREGTGRPLEWQAVHEMQLAARAEILAGNGYAAANRAARAEIHRALRAPTFADAEAATRAADRATRTAREAWRDEDCQPNAIQPQAAEFLAENDDESANPAAALIARFRESRAALRAVWDACGSPYAATGLRKDRALLRAQFRAEMRGERLLNFVGRKGDKAAENAYRAALGLRDRVNEGRAILARVAEKRAALREAPAGEYETPALRAAREERAAREAARGPLLWTLRTGREVTAEKWEESLAAGRLPLVERLLAAAHASRTHGSVKGTHRRAGRATGRQRAARVAQSTLRAPLPAVALGALDKVRGK